MKRIVLLPLFLLTVVAAFAQTAVTADEAFQAKNYNTAKMQYKSLLEKTPKNQLYLYRLARCCQELGEVSTAIEYFELAGDKYDLKNFFLGELYFKTYRFEDAIVSLEKYYSKIDSTDVHFSQTEKMLTDAAKMLRFLKRAKIISIIDSTTILKADFLQAYKQISKSSGSLSYNDSNQVVYTNERENVRLWAVPDSSNGQRMSIVVCSRLLDGWSNCDTLQSPVNSNSNDAFPFVSADGLTLYFASDREGGCGGYDIYMTRKNPETNVYFTPENLGFPFNSPANDYMLAIDETNGIGYFATDRRAPADSVVVYRYNIAKTELFKGSADSLRWAAQLLLYNIEVVENDTIENLDIREDVSLVVEQPDADETGEELNIEVEPMVLTTDSILSELRDLRLQYMNAEADDERMRLSKLILQKERQLLEAR